jgi:anhydro-N-acetylmuramic acid kinase
MMSEHYIGLMSGTSMDGVDGVLVAFDEANSHAPLRVLAHHALPLGEALRQSLMSLNQSGPDELHRAALAANALVSVYAEVVHALLQHSGLNASQISAIGAHGQTVRHQPGLHDGVGYTWQLNQPALLAERCGIDVVADFRSRDVAAGGQGAPLVPLFHQTMFGRADQTVAVLNIGGIANLSVLHPSHGGDAQDAPAVLGWDCGPGNVLLDLWCQQHTGQSYDANGAWAASGQVIPGLLQALLQEPYFQAPPPKSTGRDLFHAAWLNEHLRATAHAPHDVQATLTALTAISCANDVQRHAPEARSLLVCGGGARNVTLMQHLAKALPQVEVCSTERRGLPPLQVEAAAFAWLARQCVTRQNGNLPSVTGARGARVLGAIYPR